MKIKMQHALMTLFLTGVACATELPTQGAIINISATSEVSRGELESLFRRFREVKDKVVYTTDGKADYSKASVDITFNRFPYRLQRACPGVIEFYRGTFNNEEETASNIKEPNSKKQFDQYAAGFFSVFASGFVVKREQGVLAAVGQGERPGITLTYSIESPPSPGTLGWVNFMRFDFVHLSNNPDISKYKDVFPNS